MLPKCNFTILNDESTEVSSTQQMPSFISEESKTKTTTMVCATNTKSEKINVRSINTSKLRKFDFDLEAIQQEQSSAQISSPSDGDKLELLADIPVTASTSKSGFVKKADLRIQLSEQPTLVVQSPKTPTLSRKLKAVSLDSDSNTSESPADCLEIPRDTFSMPNTPKKQIPKMQTQKFAMKSFSGGSLVENSVSTNLSSYASNQSISGSQTLKTLPEVMTLSDFSQGKTEPVRVKAKGLLERRGSNVSLTIDLCAVEAKTNNYRLNTARSVSNLNLTNLGAIDKCKCKSEEAKCECIPKRKDCKKCSGNLKKFQKLSTESCLCDENINNTNGQGYKVCQYSRLGCLNYLSYMRRKSLSNENLYIGPSYEFRKLHRKTEYPKNALAVSQFKNQILSEDFQLHLQNIQYLQTAGNVLSKKQLRDSCKIEHLKDLHKEFWELPQNFQEKSFVSGSQSKNRYKTILPNEHSRVVLDVGQGQDVSGAEGYINANYIKGHDYTETAYIATQGPLPHTTSDLWQMVVQSSAQKVVMLTPIEEKGRIKCDIYFPEQVHTQIVCGKFEITCLDIQNEKSYNIRTLRIRDTTTKIKTKAAVVESPKYCCDKMKQCGIECKKLKKPNEFLTKTISDNVLNKLESNQNSPKHLVSPLVVTNNNSCNNRFFNENIDDNTALDLVECVEDDDIFTNIEYKSNNRPSAGARTQLRSRDCKFSDDFTDIINSSIEFKNLNIEQQQQQRTDEIQDDIILETDRIVQHYWYQTWPDHNLANTEEILALALDVLDLREEIVSLYKEITPRPSHLIKNKIQNSNHLVVVDSLNKDNCQRNNLASKNIAANLNEKSQFRMHMDKLKESNFSRSNGQKVNEKNTVVPIIVHCSAGIGRTGCFLAILNGIQQLKHNCNVDILAIVCALRLNRGGMVQTAEQYELIHKVLALYDQYVDK